MKRDIIEVVDEKRGCGWRREGVYLVSGSKSTGGYGVSEEAAGLIRLDPPVPVDRETVPSRGFVYVDGAAILEANPEQALAAPRIESAIAEARAFSWRAFGLDYADRLGAGVCAQAKSVAYVVETITALSWRDKSAYQRWAGRIHRVVSELRRARGDVELFDVVIAAKQVRQAVAAEMLAPAGAGLSGAGRALACTWRLVDAARRAGLVEIVQIAAGRLMPAIGAVADAPFALRYRPPEFHIYPDLLDWVGQRHYPQAEDFIEEADRQGISRRLPGIPKALVTPWSRSFLAHADVELADGTRGPAIFGYYRAAQMQYVVGEHDAVPPWLEAYGVQPVKVRRRVEQAELFHV
jgi:hypothetical protein